MMETSTSVTRPTTAQFIALFLDFDHLVIDAAEADGFAADSPDEVDQVFVDLTGQDHLDDFHRFCVGDAQAVEEFDSMPNLLSVSLMCGPPPWTRTTRTPMRFKRTISPNRCLVFVDHGIAAVFDDDDFVAVFSDVRQSVHQDLRLLGIDSDLTSSETSSIRLNIQ